MTVYDNKKTLKDHKSSDVTEDSKADPVTHFGKDEHGANQVVIEEKGGKVTASSASPAAQKNGSYEKLFKKIAKGKQTDSDKVPTMTDLGMAAAQANSEFKKNGPNADGSFDEKLKKSDNSHWHTKMENLKKCMGDGMQKSFEKGVHKPALDSKGGTSGAGLDNMIGDHQSAKARHSNKLAELKTMKKPNLTKSDPPPPPPPASQPPLSGAGSQSNVSAFLGGLNKSEKEPNVVSSGLKKLFKSIKTKPFIYSE